MPYLIDGHNLIGAMPGLSLSDPDDEARLTSLLQRFCSRRRQRVTVYFDRRAPASPQPTAMGCVTARFVTASDTADAAIRRHLQRLGGEARNWTVVSSDSEVTQAARRAGARPIASRDFAEMLQRAVSPFPGEKPLAPPTPQEVRDLERAMRRRRQR